MTSSLVMSLLLTGRAAVVLAVDHAAILYHSLNHLQAAHPVYEMLPPASALQSVLPALTRHQSFIVDKIGLPWSIEDHQIGDLADLDRAMSGGHVHTGSGIDSGSGESLVHSHTQRNTRQIHHEWLQ